MSNLSDLDLLNRLMAQVETEHLEFKEAKTDYDFEKLVKYCCALANEQGGHFVLGVTDKIPRRIVGTQAFLEPGKTKNALILKHLKKHKKVGAPLSELKQVLPALSQGQLQKILQEMKNDGQILVKGQTRGAKWFPASG